MGVYVDDLLIAGPRSLNDSLNKAVWKTSTPEHLGPDPDCVPVLRFLGMNLERVDVDRSVELELPVGTIQLNQMEYIIEVRMKFEPTSLITHDPDTCFIRVKHICQYLHHTLGYALRSVPRPPQSKHKLWVLGDASFLRTRETSQHGVVVYHGITSNQRKGGNLVQWRSSRQDLIAKSTCEADLIASSEFNREKTS